MVTLVFKIQYPDIPGEDVLVSIIPAEIKGFLQDEDLLFNK